jgi:tRNA-dihydrouridine synthase A
LQTFKYDKFTNYRTLTSATANNISGLIENFSEIFDMREKPVALQLGGSSPKLLANAAFLGEEFGYDEINLNLGCPSKKVQKNIFGACLIQEPNLVADCLSHMISKTSLPVTVKTRIGYDNVDQYENLYNFINTLKDTGVKTFIIHARKAMLGKFTPKQNLNIPPLKYEYVNKLKKDFKNLEIIINGGITSADQIKDHLKNVDGVMIGRSIYQSPYMLADIEKEIFNNEDILTRQEVVEKLMAEFSITHLRDIKATALSGGERRRTEIAR